jgi:hypothetical protein
MEQEWRRCPKCGRGIAIKRDGTFRRRRKGNNRMAYLTRKNQIRLEPTPPAPDVSTFEGQRRTYAVIREMAASIAALPPYEDSGVFTVARMVEWARAIDRYADALWKETKN